MILTLRPSADGASRQHAPSIGGYTNYVCVDEDPANDSDYVLNGTTGTLLDLYVLAGYTGVESGIINSVKVYHRCGMGGPYMRAALRLSSTNYYGGSESGQWYSYVLYSYTWLTRPSDSAAWTWTDIYSMQAGVSTDGSGGQPSPRCSQLYVEVDYTPFSMRRRTAAFLDF